MNPDILNDGLDLAMAWGEDWLKPIQPRLAKLHPELSAEELEAYNTVCQEAMLFGCEKAKQYTAIAMAEEHTKNLELFSSQIRQRYPWANDDNLSCLFSQGIYYALK
jgi:hypothetical protein